MADFFNTYKNAALRIEAETGVPAYLSLSQAALESGFGTKAPGNNFFGIKGTGPAGTQLLWTTEVINGREVRVQDYFRVYNSAEEAFRDHAELISQNPSYRKVMDAAKTGDAKKVAQAIGLSGYASDPSYGQKIFRLIENYRLGELKQEEISEERKPTQVKKLTPEQLKRITDNWRSEAEAVALRSPQPTPTPTSGWQAWLKRLAPEKETELLSPLPAKSPQPTPQAVAPGGFTPVAPAYTPANAPYTPANFTPVAQPRQVTVQRGQTPGGLAQAYLGNWQRWREIWPGNPRQMPTGATLKIPVPSIAGTA